jgi:ubiquinone/menaquinone biosynthesis C-methylase UbiE
MAVDIQQMITNLLEFFDLTNKTIISVGAGGGQFIEYGRNANKVFAIDSDEPALEMLKENLIKSGLTEKFTLIHSDFYLTDQKGDVVIFELSLHELSDPAIAVRHALTLAPNVLILDHWVSSDWVYFIDEKEKVTRSWTALEAFDFKKFQQYDTFEFFDDYEELYEKIKGQGETAISRIEEFKDQKQFTIPLSYALALISVKS